MGFCSLDLLISDIIGARARQTSSAVVNLNPGHIRLCARIDAAPYSRYYLWGDARAMRLMIPAEENGYG